MSHSPGRGWIILGILLILISIVFVVVGVAWSFSSFDLKQVVMPGTLDFEMVSPGTVYIAYEPVSSFDGEFLASPEVPTMSLALVSPRNGQQVTMQKNPMVKATYSMGTRRGFYIGSAELDQGSWQLIGSPGAETRGREVFAIGHSSVNSIVMPIIVAGIAAALTGPLGLGCLVVGIVQRIKNRSQARELPRVDSPE